MNNGRVDKLQYIERNVLLGTQGLDNRWLITFNVQEARDELMRHGMTFFNQRVTLRRYDDIMAEEYAEYTRYINHYNYRRRWGYCEDIYK